MGNRPRRVRLSVVAAATGATVLAFSAVLASPTSAGAREPVVLTTAALPALVIGPGKTTIRYCDESGVTETLDIDEPNPLPTTPVPAVVYIHGGGWVQGDSALTPGSLVSQLAEAIEAEGWVFVSIDYRLAPRFRLAGPDPRRRLRRPFPAGRRRHPPHRPRGHRGHGRQRRWSDRLSPGSGRSLGRLRGGTGSQPVEHRPSRGRSLRADRPDHNRLDPRPAHPVLRLRGLRDAPSVPAPRARPPPTVWWPPVRLPTSAPTTRPF